MHGFRPLRSGEVRETCDLSATLIRTSNRDERERSDRKAAIPVLRHFSVERFLKTCTTLFVFIHSLF